MDQTHREYTGKFEPLFASVFEMAQAAMMVISDSGEPVAVNRAARLLVGLPEWQGPAVAGSDPAMAELASALSGLSRFRWDGRFHELSMPESGGDPAVVLAKVVSIPMVNGLYGLVSFAGDPLADRSRDRVAALAMRDPLTGCLNRRGLNRCLDAGLQRARLTGESFAVILADLNGFKEVNDRFGHQFGDRVLVAVASRLRCCLRKDDHLFRLGGDEFVVVTSPQFERCQVEAIGDRLIHALAREGVQLQEQAVTIGVSLGICFCPDDADDSTRLIHLADMAMYRAKMSGHSSYAFAGG